MDIKCVSVSQINPAVYNPRKISEQELQKLKQSIVTFGYVEPIVWNCQTGNLVGGHQRFKIILEQGLKEIEVSVVDLSLEKEKTLNLALNKIQGQWDQDKLALLIQELADIPDFNIGLTGFNVPEISNILDGLANTQEDDFDINKFVEAIDIPITQKGDLIELGQHRIFCGDSSSKEDLKKLVGNLQVNLVYTDPPYNVDYYGGDRPNKKSRPSNHKLWQRIYSDNMTQEGYESWLKQIFSNLTSYLGSGAPIYVWNGHKQFGPMYLMLIAMGFHISCVITWAKEAFAFGHGDYHQKTEFCLYGWKMENGAHFWYGANNESTLWEIHRDPTKSYIHPTQKPIALAQRAIKNSSKRGDIVMDLFLGSGSTLIAAESLGRRCFGVEIDPKYVDGIVKRYITYVGKENVSAEIRNKYIKEVNHG